MVLTYLKPKQYKEGTEYDRLTEYASVSIADNGLEFFETDTGILYRVCNGAWLAINTGGGGGVTTFLELDDVLEVSYSGAGGQLVAVDGTETGLEFVDVPAHNITGTSHAVTGSQYDIVGLTAINTLGLLTPSSAPGVDEIVKTNSSGTIEFNHIGINVPAVASSALNIEYTFSDTVANRSLLYANMIAFPLSSPSYTMIRAGEFISVYQSSADFTGGTVYGIRSISSNSGASTVDTLVAVYGATFNSGIVGSAIGLHIDSPTGTITDGYGIKIEDISTATNNYAIYTGLGLNSLGGDLQFRQAATISTTTGQLTINGVASSAVVFNETGADVDFRVESAGNVNMLFVDAGNNGIGIGTNSLSAKAHVVSASNYATGFRVDHTTLNTGTLEVGAWVVVSGNPSSAPGVGTSYRGLLLQAGTAGSTSLANVTLYGALMQATHANSSTLSTAISNSFGIFNSGGGTITTAYGAAIGGSNNGTITTYVGINISQQTGTVGTQYGIVINNFNSASTNYAIYTNAGDIRLMASASDKIGFHGSAPVAKQTVSGSRGGNAALASLLTALANLGLITNSTTA